MSNTFSERFKLVKLFGDVPLITTVAFDIDKAKHIPGIIVLSAQNPAWFDQSGIATPQSRFACRTR